MRFLLFIGATFYVLLVCVCSVLLVPLVKLSVLAK